MPPKAKQTKTRKTAKHTKKTANNTNTDIQAKILKEAQRQQQHMEARRRQHVMAGVVTGATLLAAAAGQFACGRSTQCTELQKSMTKKAATAANMLKKRMGTVKTTAGTAGSAMALPPVKAPKSMIGKSYFSPPKRVPGGDYWPAPPAPWRYDLKQRR